MTGEESAPTITNLDELLDCREKTERISNFLYKRLKDQLGTLSSLLAPGRVLGKHVGARESPARADEAFAEISQKYQQVRGGPFDLKPEMDPDLLAATGSVIHIYPLEYSHEAKGAKGSKTIAIASSVRWVVTYGSEYSLSQLRSLLLGQGDRKAQSVRQFAINALAFQVVLGRSPGVSQMLGDLRYKISVEPLPGLEKLPMTHLSVQLPSFRPPDELLLTAVRLSGVPAFIELIDMNAVENLEDPLRQQIMAQAAGEE